MGTGLNAHPLFAGKVVKEICALMTMPFVEAPNKFEGIGNTLTKPQRIGCSHTLSDSSVRRKEAAKGRPTHTPPNG